MMYHVGSQTLDFVSRGFKEGVFSHPALRSWRSLKLQAKLGEVPDFTGEPMKHQEELQTCPNKAKRSAGSGRPLPRQALCLALSELGGKQPSHVTSISNKTMRGSRPGIFVCQVELPDSFEADLQTWLATAIIALGGDIQLRFVLFQRTGHTKFHRFRFVLLRSLSVCVSFYSLLRAHPVAFRSIVWCHGGGCQGEDWKLLHQGIRRRRGPICGRVHCHRLVLRRRAQDHHAELELEEP